MSVVKRVLELRRGHRPLSFKSVHVRWDAGVIRLYAHTVGKRGSKKKKERKSVRKGLPFADAMLREMGPHGIPYSVYLKTTHWQDLRWKVFQADKKKCVRCGKPGSTVHHRTYSRLGRELLEDVVTVCVPCHNYLHIGPEPIDAVRRRNTREGRKRQKRRRSKALEATAPDRRLYKKLRFLLRTSVPNRRSGFLLGKEVRVMRSKTHDMELLQILEVLDRKMVLGHEGTLRALLIELGYRLRSGDITALITEP